MILLPEMFHSLAPLFSLIRASLRMQIQALCPEEWRRRYDVKSFQDVSRFVHRALSSVLDTGTLMPLSHVELFARPSVHKVSTSHE